MKKKQLPISETGKLPYTQQLKRDKAIRLFWKSFGYDDPDEVPAFHHHVDLRCTHFTDDDMALLLTRVKSINMLDLNETPITNKTIEYLTQLDFLNELRVKECHHLNDLCIPFLNQLTSLRFLHVKCTGITINGLLQLNALTQLETLIFSADSPEAIQPQLQQLHALLPGCELAVNGRYYHPDL